MIGAPKQAGDHHAAAELPEAGQPQPSTCARLLLGSTLIADHQRPRRTAPTAAFCVPGGGWRIAGERCSFLEPHLSQASEPRVLFTAVQHSGASVCSGAAVGLQDREGSSWHELACRPAVRGGLGGRLIGSVQDGQGPILLQGGGHLGGVSPAA